MFRVLTCLAGEHDLRLVAVAGVICFFASLSAITLFHRAREAKGRIRATWVLAAGFAAGSGIWATHFIAMLAFDAGVAVAYKVGLTALSLVIAVAITGLGLGLGVYVRQPWAAPCAGAIVGGGVACMHYLGMWALEVPGRVNWSTDLVVASIVLGILFGVAAMTVASRGNDRRHLFLGSLLLTLGIVLHHFTGMGGVAVVPDPSRVINTLSLSPAALAVAVTSLATAILGTSLASAFADRRLSNQSDLLNVALNNMSQGIVMFDSERLVVCNESYVAMYGLSPDVVKPGCTLTDIIQHRISIGSLGGEAEKYRAGIMSEIAQGKIVKRVVETNGRSISVTNRPLADGRYWVGTHEDITDLRRAEQQRASIAEHRTTLEAAVAAFRGSVDTVLQTLGESTSTNKTTAMALAASSSETAQQAAQSVHTSGEASNSVTLASTAAAELKTSIATIGEQLGQATNLIDLAVGEATVTNDEITRLAQAVQEIGDVVSLIRQIAGQTNLLALNATIEAARAGESGRGFAVVASEVKSLAVQTAQATEQIAAQISAVQTSTKTAVEAIRRNTKRMEEINHCTSAVATSVDHQNVATEAISHNVRSAAEGTLALSSTLQTVAGAVARTQSSADTVLSASKAVEAAVAALRGELEDFLGKVAA